MDGVLIGVGVTGLLVVAVWGWMGPWYTRRRCATLLGVDDPRARAEAVVDLVELGLGRAAPTLLVRVPRDPDPRVRLAAALAVARKRLDPDRDGSTAALGGWAIAELQRQEHDRARSGLRG